MKKILAALFLLAIFGFLGWLLAPSLWSDFQLRNQQLVEATDVDVSDGKCQTKLFLLSFCEIEFTDAAKSKHSFTYFITGMDSGESFSVLRSPQNGELYTTSLGMTYFINRAASFLIGAGLLLAFIVGAALSKSEKAVA